MRLHRFYTTQDIGDEKEIVISSPGLIHQIQNVFRLNIGDEVIIFNGTGFDYECKIDRLEKKNKIDSDSVLRLTVIGSKRNNFSSRNKLFLCAALVKKDKFEWIVEKATELGVTDIIPIAAERSEKKSLNGERLVRIAIEASEQSGRDTTPTVHNIMGLGSAVDFLKREIKAVKIVAFHTEGESDYPHLSQKVSRSAPIAVFIGPEGGWTTNEIDMFHKEKVPVVCLGHQILRSETAAVAALSVVIYS